MISRFTLLLRIGVYEVGISFTIFERTANKPYKINGDAWPYSDKKPFKPFYVIKVHSYPNFPTGYTQHPQRDHILRARFGIILVARALLRMHLKQRQGSTIYIADSPRPLRVLPGSAIFTWASMSHCLVHTLSPKHGNSYEVCQPSVHEQATTQLMKHQINTESL